MPVPSVAAPVEGPRRARHVRRLAVLVAAPTALLGMTLLSTPAAHALPAPAGSLTRVFDDGPKDWTVPAGVYSVSLTAAGGSGAAGHGGAFGSAGGAGGH